MFLNIAGNKIKKIPNSIARLDTSKGGSLLSIAVRESEVGAANYRLLEEYLPNVEFKDKAD